MDNEKIMKSVSLSKSLFIRGLQCHKSLYLNKYRPELKDEISDAQMALFQSGTEVGILAQGIFPGGTEIPYEGLSHQEQLDLTQELIRKGATTLYEATFQYEGVFIKADIIHKSDSGWEIYEVKSSTELKPVHVNDVAVQYYVLSGSGIDISKACLVLINNQYVRNGNIDIHELFAVEDLTEEVKDLQSSIGEELARQKQMLSLDEPLIDIGSYCNNPYTCDFKGHCWSHIPEDSIFDIRGRVANKFDLYRMGHLSMYDVPESYLSPDQIIQVRSNISKCMSVNKKALKAFLNTVKYPLYFLDFETFMMPVPPYDGIRPYQQIPFQYSLHRLDDENAELKHSEFLAWPKQDPRRDFIEQLIRDIPLNACIMVYNKTFEKGVLKSLVSWFPEYADTINTMIENIVDLMGPFKNKDYYHWQMNGSYSIKSVLPALVPELSYAELEINEGGLAMNAYHLMNQLEDPEEINQIRKALLEYCGLDTLAMVKILDKIENVL